MRPWQSDRWRQKITCVLYGTALIVLLCSGSAMAGQQAERAIAAVKALIASGQVAPDATVRIVAKDGNINNFWGENFELKNAWETRTGILLDARLRPNLPALDFMRQDKAFDLTLARQAEYPDLYTEHLIADLTPYANKYGLVLHTTESDSFLNPKAQTEFDRKIVAIPADGDLAVLYLRKDWLEDPAHQRAFQQKYQRPLQAPKTWAEYQELVEFFHRPEQGIYGTCENRDPQTGWMYWMLRYVSQAYPNQYLFDDNMRPLLDSPQGIAATEQYVRTIAFSPPEITAPDNAYNYSLPIYKNGKAFSYILTMSSARLFNEKNSPIKDKFFVSLMPGTQVQEKLVRRTSFIYGNNIVITEASPQKELAFLFAMWLTDPDISTRMITVLNGLADPFRRNHLTDPGVVQRYTSQALERLGQEFEQAVPSGTGLPGDAEYIQALNNHLWLAAQGKVTPREAMVQTAAQWNTITEKYGRQSQAQYWQNFKTKFPQ